MYYQNQARQRLQKFCGFNQCLIKKLMEIYQTPGSTRKQIDNKTFQISRKQSTTELNDLLFLKHKLMIFQEIISY